MDDEENDLGIREIVGYAGLCDGPYQMLGAGCYRRAPCQGSDDLEYRLEDQNELD